MALLALVLQFVLTSYFPALSTADAILWRLAAFFPVLTLVAIIVQMTAVALGADLSARRAGGLTLAMLASAALYHGIVDDLRTPRGIGWWAEHGMNSAVPVYMALFWLLYARKSALVYGDALVWALWPLGYSAYALLRGAVGGFWAYPFLDLSVHGLGGVMLRLALLLAAYVLAGMGLVWLGRQIRARSTAPADR